MAMKKTTQLATMFWTFIDHDGDFRAIREDVVTAFTFLIKSGGFGTPTDTSNEAKLKRETRISVGVGTTGIYERAKTMPRLVTANMVPSAFKQAKKKKEAK